MATELWAIGLVLLASFLGSLGPIMLKKASDKMSFNIFHLFRNYHLILGFGFYGVGTILFIPALKGGDLNVLYPLVAFTYIWVCLWSSMILKEKMNLPKWLGIILIIIGVSFIGIGS